MMGGTIPCRSLCPELHTLRTRKKELLVRLEQLQKEGRDAGAAAKESISPQSMEASIDWGTNSSCFLPERRKTQWDYVLEEMRWLSTDFVEERKWKVAGARAISTAVALRAPSKRRSLKRKQGIRPSSSSSERDKALPLLHVMDVSSSRVEDGMDSAPNLTEQLDSKMEDPSCCNVITPEMELEVKKYEDATEEDIEQSRKVSKILGTVVQAQWDSIAKDGDSLQSQSKIASSYVRFLRSINDTKGHLADKEESMDGVMTKYSDNSQKQLSYDEILQNLVNILEVVSEHKSNLENSKNEIGNELNFEPCNSQRKGLQFVENLWRSGLNSSPGVVFKGLYGCGKTVLTALIARRRLKMGPQLVLCPSSSVVSWPSKIDLFIISILLLNLL